MSDPRTASLDEPDDLEEADFSADGPAEAVTREFAGGPADSPRVSKATLGMIGLFLAGAAVVGILSLRGGPSKADAKDQAVETRVETFINQNQRDGGLAKDFQETKKVVDAFYNYASRHQVPVEDLKANPFVFDQSKKGAGAAKAADTSKETARRQAELQGELGKLTLQSVMMGARGGTAIVNNNFVAEGHKLGSFTVTKIQPGQVQLTCEGAMFLLRPKE
jgi:hypothetical protein